MLSIFKKPNKDTTTSTMTQSPQTQSSLRDAMVAGAVKKASPLKPMNEAPAPPPVKEQPAPPVQQAPVKGGDLVIEENFNSIVDEVAMQFANGSDDLVQTMLISHLNETKGNTDKRIWFMLLDLYQVLGDRTAYEKMAELFARRFSSSPPSWTEPVVKNKQKPASGKNVLILEGGITPTVVAKFKDFQVAVKETKTCKIDCSRMKLDQTDIDGVKSIQETMAYIRKVKADGLLMGDGIVTDALKKLVDASKEKPLADEKDIPFWLLYLEFLQWQGKSEAFEEYAIEFAVKYELSAPGWEDSGVMKSGGAPLRQEPETSVNQSGAIDPPEMISEGNVSELQAVVELMLKNGKEAIMDFSSVRRMDFNGAGVFSSFVMSLPTNSPAIIVKEPNEFVLAAMDMMGITGSVKIIQRKR